MYVYPKMDRFIKLQFIDVFPITKRNTRRFKKENKKRNLNNWYEKSR